MKSQGNEALLRPVVEVSLDAATLGIGGGDDAGAGVAQLFQLLTDPLLQAVESRYHRAKLVRGRQGDGL